MKELTKYELKIKELHGEIEDKARELQSKIESLETTRTQILESQTHKSDLIKAVKEKEEELKLLDNAIKERNRELVDSLQPKQKIAEELKNYIISLKATLESLGLEAFSKRITENTKLIEENERIIKDKEKLEKSLSTISSDLTKLQDQVKDLQNEKKRLLQELQRTQDEYLFMQKQIEGINAKFERVRFYARRLAKAGGKNLLEELEDLGPFKFFPSRKLQDKLDKEKNGKEIS